LAVLVEGLRKTYGGKAALDGLDLTVAAGTVHGLLGPNGAGKTTAVRILATLLRFDSGRAEVAGFDVKRDPAQVRYRIGLLGQHAAIDRVLSGRQNLEMFGRLYHLSPREARNAQRNCSTSSVSKTPAASRSSSTRAVCGDGSISPRR